MGSTRSYMRRATGRGCDIASPAITGAPSWRPVHLLHEQLRADPTSNSSQLPPARDRRARPVVGDLHDQDLSARATGIGGGVGTSCGRPESMIIAVDSNRSNGAGS